MQFNMYPVLAKSNYKIKPAQQEFGLKPIILTDEAISVIRNKVTNEEDKLYTVTGTIIGVLTHFSSLFRVQIPMIGEGMENAVKQLHTNFDLYFNAQYNELDYLTGKGPVGSYIENLIFDMRLLSSKERDKTSETSQLEEEYLTLFNYEPVNVSTYVQLPANGSSTSRSEVKNEELLEVEKLFTEWGKIVAYIYHFKRTYFDDELCAKKGSVTLPYYNDSAFNINYEGDGIFYSKPNATPIILARVPYRDTCVELIYSVTTDRLYRRVFHRTEGVWVDVINSWLPGIKNSVEEVLTKKIFKDFDIKPIDFDQLAVLLKTVKGFYDNPEVQPILVADEKISNLTDNERAFKDVFKGFNFTHNFTCEYKGVKYVYQPATEFTSAGLVLECSYSNSMTSNWRETLIATRMELDLKVCKEPNILLQQYLIGEFSTYLSDIVLSAQGVLGLILEERYLKLPDQGEEDAVN